MRDLRTAPVSRRLAPIGLSLLLGAVAGACSSSLVDHSAGSDVLNPSGCPAGQVSCGSTCVAEDAYHCGSACASCASAVPPDPNAGPVCTEDHACCTARDRCNLLGCLSLYRRARGERIASRRRFDE